MSLLPKSTGWCLPTPSTGSSSTQHICHPQHCPAELQLVYFPFWLLGRLPEGLFLVTSSASGYRVCHTDSLPMTLQGRTAKCFKHDLMQSFKLCGKASSCVAKLCTAEKQQQQSDQLSRKLLRLGHLGLSKGICPVEAEAALMTVTGFVPNHYTQ